MVLIVVLAAAVSAAILGYLAVTILVHRSAVQRTVAELDKSGIEADRKAELGLFARFFDERGRTNLERRLVQAGWYKTTPGRYMMHSIVASGAGLFVGLLIPFVLHKTQLYMFMLPVLLALAGAIAPTSMLDGAIAERKKRIRNSLPDFLDLVSTTVEAGIALNGAFAAAVDAVRGPFRDELLAALSDIRVGRSRAEALAAMAARCDVVELTTTVTAIVQAEKLGGDIAGILDQLATEAREHRMMRAEEIANQLPVTMTFPMAICMLPALFVMIFGAVAAQMIGH
ncbi:MAG TPA: type II secretion system F family protein [Candidatus Elarobacter sp.]|jgi:tight adherence protein C|nr:type II secretion system F family protein [Candidatus Elarobacter sp.]